MIVPDVIDRFRGQWAFLSNFHERWFSFRFLGPDGLVPGAFSARTAEHAFQASKTWDFAERVRILDAETPREAKRRGRQAQLRPDWEDVKLDVMRSIVQQKFRDERMEMGLLATGQALLIEGNTWGDEVWGCVRVGQRWEGRNLLGQVLMETRDSIIARALLIANEGE